MFAYVGITFGTKGTHYVNTLKVVVLRTVVSINEGKLLLCTRNIEKEIPLK